MMDRFRSGWAGLIIALAIGAASADEAIAQSISGDVSYDTEGVSVGGGADCVGDCANDGQVTVADVITGISIALGFLPVSACPAFAVDGVVTIVQLTQGINNLLAGCPGRDFIDVSCLFDSTDQPDSPSRMELITAAFTLALPINGALNLNCNEALGEGRYSCSCESQTFEPIVLPGIGVSCIGGVPGCPLREIDCDGGTALSLDLVSDGSLSQCMGNDECRSQCEQYCTSIGTIVAARLEDQIGGIGCTGYCAGGENSGNSCSVDAECPGGLCNGTDNGPSDICQCQCLDLAAGGPGAAGELQCFLGLSLTIEAGLPCDGSDTIANLGAACVPLTTGDVSNLIANSNFTDSPIPVDGLPVTARGMPVGCDALNAGIATGLQTRGIADIFGSLLGDTINLFHIQCQ